MLYKEDKQKTKSNKLLKIEKSKKEYEINYINKK